MALQPFLSNRPASEATFAANSDGTPHAARSGGFQQLFECESNACGTNFFGVVWSTKGGNAA